MNDPVIAWKARYKNLMYEFVKTSSPDRRHEIIKEIYANPGWQKVPVKLSRWMILRFFLAAARFILITHRRKFPNCYCDVSTKVG